MIFLISQRKHMNICCDPSLEPSLRDGSNDGSQNNFYGKIWIIIPKLSLLPLLIWSTGLLMEVFRNCSHELFAYVVFV